MNLNKIVYTDADFEEMNWHDNKIYAMAFGAEEHEIMFDIDYIFKCTGLKTDGTYADFLVSPATLVFRNVYDFYVSSFMTNLTIIDIGKSNSTLPKNADHFKNQIEHDWTIETTSGEITFKSTGYDQFIRQVPVLSKSQEIGFVERGGISFGIVSS